MTSQATELVDAIRPLKRCAVAFSGGVDSAVVAKAARLALGPERCVAVTAVSPSVARIELETATSVAMRIGIDHQLVRTEEIDNPAYVANDGKRCFHCKSELYSKLQAVCDRYGDERTILNGTNFDDLGDYRPGLQAAENFSVISPLADLGLTKSMVRQVAKEWGLPVWNKPASPCLASRIAYGETVSPAKLAMIEAAEAFLRRHGFQQLRVRYYPGDAARIEVERQQLPLLLADEFFEETTRQLTEIGFRSVEVDPEGFRSGNLNQSLATYQISSN